MELIYEHSKSNNELKRCSKCGEFKTTKDNFYKRKTGRYDSYCRACKNEQSKEIHKERYHNDEQYRDGKKNKSRKK